MDRQRTYEVVSAYLDGHDPRWLAPDAVFRDTASGRVTAGRDAIGAMLHHVYHVAFEAHVEVRNLVVAQGKAAVEAEIVGRHTGEFAGVPATGIPVLIPLAVVYDVADGLITNGAMYLQVMRFLQQCAIADPGATASPVRPRPANAPALVTPVVRGHVAGGDGALPVG